MSRTEILTQAEWQDLREQIFVLLDITWDYGVNVATLEQLSVKRRPKESLADYNRRTHQVYQQRFKEIKSDSFDRVAKVLGYLKRLGLPQEMWPREMEIRNIAGEAASDRRTPKRNPSV